jgi:uncharacterized protein YndB with AHSA1/START domain
MIADISHSIDIEAPLERVWTALTDESLVAQWLGCMGFKSEIGHVFYMQQDRSKAAAGDTSGATHCELLKLDAPNEMLFSWYFPDFPKTHVSIRLTSTETGTRADLLHSGWDQFDAQQIRSIRDGLEGGWKSFVLPQLKRVAEQQG